MNGAYFQKIAFMNGAYFPKNKIAYITIMEENVKYLKIVYKKVCFFVQKLCKCSLVNISVGD